MNAKKLFGLFLAAALASASFAKPANAWEWWDNWTDNLKKAWNSDKYQAMLPVHMYHVRASYTKHEIDKYNEDPWGLGIMKYFETEEGIRHSIYGIVFLDSYRHPEPTVGYNWGKMWYGGENNDFGAGLGLSFILTSRVNNNLVPIPGILPTATLEYKNLGLQTAWVPYLGKSNGNIFLTTLNWKF